MNITKKERRQRRAVKTRARIRTLGVARLTVHRTPRHIYAQLFDAAGAHVLVAASTVQESADCFEAISQAPDHDLDVKPRDGIIFTSSTAG